MKKFLLSIFCCLMAVFAVQAQSTKTYTYDFSSNSNWVTVAGGTTAVATGSSNKLSDFYHKESGDKFDANGKGYFNTQGYFLWGKSGAYIELPTFSGEKITNITATSSSQGSTSVQVGVYSGSTVVCSPIIWSSKNTDFSYDISEEYQSSVLRLQVSSAHNAQITKLVVTTIATGEGGEGGDTPDTPVVVAPDAPTLPVDCNFDTEMTVEITGVADGATAYYSLNNETDWVEGTSVTITETTTVYAKVVKDELSSEVVSATYTKKTIVAGNWNLVSNVAELSAGDEVVIVAADYDFALSATQNTNNRAQAEVQKEGNAIKFTNDVQVITLEAGNVDGTFAFNTGDGYLHAASSTSNHLRTEATLSDNSSWSIAIANGVATIVAQGTNTRNTMQYNQSSKLFACYSSASQKAVSIYKNFEEGEEPVVVPAAPVISTPEGVTNFEENIVVTISAESGMTIYYTTDGNDPTNASDVYSAPLEITETTTVKAIAVNGEGVSSAVASSKYTKVAASVEGTVADAIAAYVDGYEIPATITGYIVGAVDGSINKAENFTGETTVAANILIADDANETDAAKCIPVQLSSGAFRTALNLADNTGNYKKKITVSGDLTAYFSVAGIKNVNAAGVYQTVSNVGWSTLYLGYNAVVPNTVKAYVATEIVSNSVILEQIEGTIDAETGVILEGEGEHLFNVASEAAGNEKGLLKGSVAAENVTPVGTAYVLSAPAGVVGLYIAELAEGAFLNNANKAYLDVANSNDIASYSFNFDWNGTTGVEGVVAEGAQDGAIYDITGRRVKAITAPGIYIVNGKKVVK